MFLHTLGQKLPFAKTSNRPKAACHLALKWIFNSALQRSKHVDMTFVGRRRHDSMFGFPKGFVRAQDRPLTDHACRQHRISRIAAHAQLPRDSQPSGHRNSPSSSSLNAAGYRQFNRCHRCLPQMALLRMSEPSALRSSWRASDQTMLWV